MELIKKVVFYLFLVLSAIVILVIATGGIFFLYAYFKTSDLPNIKKLSDLKLNRSSYIYSKDEKIAGRFFYENRDPVKFKDIPPLVKNAILATEDERFFYSFYHFGIDPISIVRAFVHNTLARRTVSGASTITQQLTRQLYENEVPEFRNREVRYKRKWKEARLAVQLEKHYSKEEIFEAYVNYVYLGHGRFGVVEAGRYYFSRELKDLTIPEAAILAALIKSPARFSPINQEKAAIERRNRVLMLMAENKFITKEEYEQLKLERISLNVSKTEPSFAYAKDFVRRVLLEKGYDSEKIWHRGGLKVKTTIDSRIQKIATEVLKEHLAKLNSDWKNDKEKLEGAVVVIENFSGKIAAVVGGHDFAETKYNRAVQQSAIRQPGSAFKIFTYATALKEGWKFNDKICDCPIHLPDTKSFHGQVLKWWSPKNYREKSHPDFMGLIDTSDGFILSRNVATIFLASRIGIKKVIETAHEMGIKSKLDPYLPTAIGASSVGLLELTAAFSVFPNQGSYYEPVIVYEIADSEGKILYQKEPAAKNVLSPEVAEDMTVLMRAVTEIGTAKLTFKGIEQKVAGKTGTTNESRDVLFFGFTPGAGGYTIGVRLGYDMPKSIGARQTGGLLAAPICRRIVEEIYKDNPKASFSPAVEEKVQKLINPNAS
ncbi:MAG: transglycosylase domain-containing protein [Candidatus Yanofskybacteria bacterium]|nr:transglycosylase domain-containing protein [Candidatus Yanofskybacteria bacterium]